MTERSLADRLPSPGGAALWLYALVFVLVPMLLAWKGFAYIVGVVIFAVGLRPHVVALAEGRNFSFGMRRNGRSPPRTRRVSFASEKSVVRLVSVALVLFTLLVVPFLAYVLQYQAVAFYRQLSTHLPVIIEQLTLFLHAAHDRMPSVLPDIADVEDTGWQGLSSLFSQVAGDAVVDLKAALKKTSSDIVGLIGTLLADWVKLVIGAIIVGSILGSWDKEVAMHRAIVSGAILFVGFVLGFATAVPKIGGIFAMVIAFVLMATDLTPGIGWFGYTVVSFGLWIDVALRTAALLVIAKLMGLLEAYSYTPDIIGQRLGMTKMQIIATILIWAVGAGFFGMIWGIWISLAFQAALRLAQERGDTAIVGAEEKEAA